MEQNKTSERLPDIRQTITLNAPIRKVWDAVATSEGIAAWFMPNDFRPEPGYEFTLEAGPFGKSPCKVTELDPPRRLSFSWGKDWTLTFELIETGDKTEFTLIHSGWSADQVTEFGEPHTVVRERMEQGWSGIGRKLAALVEA
ncbi:SRPBCC family protein [Paenibacillus flagellatus]|uniref:SRPBCC domain-containing protein n=1 Tax=Paenibacillus flagellatus TaxID=2211139 RepID=A0A2V5JYG8_9BACL|nr:SRPBCC domain-containing protein [Paenibacillus flagellatus]PYI51939.1 SRPBCC domain-containing protein [Paenibacillus flagellatus]